jgi:hypothetical protein
MHEELSGLELHHWRSFIVDKAEEAQQVRKEMLCRHFPKPWGGLGTQECTSMMLWLAS